MIDTRSRVWAVSLLLLSLMATAASGRSTPAPAQVVEQMSAADVDRLLDSSEALLASRSFELAAPELNRALEAARQSQLEPQTARALLGLGELLHGQRQSATALAGAEEALAIYDRLDQQPGVARAHYLLSLIARAGRNRPLGLVHAQRAFDAYDRLQDRGGVARAASLILELGELGVEQAGTLTERAASEARVAGDPNVEGQLLHSMGDRLFNAGRFEESMQWLTRAASVFESVPALVDLGTVYNSIGRVYRAHGRLDEALKFQMAALEIHRKGGDQFALMQSLNAVAVVQQRLGDLASARSHLAQALAIAEKISAPRTQDFLRANMASVLGSLGQPAAAAEALELVIARGLDSFPAVRYVVLSRAYRDLGRGRDALAAAEKALAGCETEIGLCVSAYIARSEAHALSGNSAAALTDLSTAISRIEELRRQLVPADFFRQDFHRYYQTAYTSTIALQVSDGHGTAALETAELARSRAFLDLLASRSLPAVPTRVSTPIPLRLRGGGTAATSESTAMTGLAVPAVAADLASTAARLGSTMLLYWVGADETFIWVVRSDGTVETRRVKVQQSSLSALVRATSPFAAVADSATSRPNATAPPPSGAPPTALRDASAAWRELYALLIAPVRAMLPTSPGALLTIVPHDSLSTLSFAALQDRRGRHLLEDYTLHYAPAGAMLHFTAPRVRPQAGPGPASVLLVSDPKLRQQSTLDTPLPRLPGARAEAAAIARLMSAAQVTRLQDEAATETRVRDSVSSHTILHFATHAVVRDDDPFSSYLALGSSSRVADADGVLTAQEVYGLHLRADLVVLSGCQSAGGPVTGDGIATFARAFLYAGTTSFVASVWDVADEPTHQLLRDFYRTWTGGASKAASLRRAQLRLLADLRAGRVRVQSPVGEVPIPEHPVFWAGFVLFGEPR